MIRSAFRFVAAVSLLVLLAAVILGVRGRWRTDQFWLVHGDGGSEMLRSSGGRISFRHTSPNGRSRITFPRHVNHSSVPVMSQLPPMKSVRHWERRFLTFEGTPAATEQEVKAARASLLSVEALREQLDVDDEEWQRMDEVRTQKFPNLLDGYAPRQVFLLGAKATEARARELLNGTSYREWTIPAWAVTGAAGVLPVLWLSAWDRRRRLAREGRCVQCGYDLRAGPDRCPECGRVVAGARAAAPEAVTRPGTA
jgi:hypothetical protein